MNQRKIDEMIPLALDILAHADKNIEKMKAGDFALKKVYFGYLSSFGPSVVQSGMSKTLAFYAKESGDRGLILELVKQVFLRANPVYNSTEDLFKIYTSEIGKENSKTLEKLALADKILEAAIACKLVMNTYKTEEDKEGEV